MTAEKNLTSICNSCNGEFVLHLESEPKALLRPRGFLKKGQISFYNPCSQDQNQAKFLMKKEIKRLNMPFFASQALQVDFIFSYKRPVSNKLKHKTTKPDIDNLIKFYLDAMNGICFADDKQVTQIGAEKLYSDKPFIKISLRAL